jgi:hypothetical protein
MSTNEERMAALFAGYEHAYGTHGQPIRKVGAIKQEIKKSAVTLRAPVTLELWKQHLAGENPLGIIPIRADATCCFGAIDVDQYDIHHKEIVSMVEQHKLPLILTRSKSNGAHLWVFFIEPVSGEDAINSLKEIAAKLSFGGSEVFPKQAYVMWDRGDQGNWINMPYFGTTRAGVKASGSEMSIREFLSVAETSRVTLKQLQDAIHAKKKKSKATNGNGSGHILNLSDGPPCLDHLVSVGFPEGTRNNGLFALGVYARKKYGDKWKEKLEELNRTAMNPPLSADEVLMVVRSLQKKDYQYTCSSAPLCQHCNASACRTRKFGVGNSEDFPTIASISVLNSSPPLWFVDISDHRLELTSEEFLDYRRFHRVCFDRLHKPFKLMKQHDWIDIVTAAMSDCVELESSPDIGEEAEFMEHLQDFLVNRHTGQRMEDLLLSRPFESVKEKRHYFRMRDFQAYLDKEGVVMDRGRISTRIRNMGGNRSFLNIKGHGTNVWWIPTEKVQKDPELDAHPIEDTQVI